MPFGEVTLVPGVNVERTPTLNQAGISVSQLIRFRDGLTQKYGGFSKFYPFNVSGVPRELHAWEDLNSVNHLLVGTTTQLGVITSGSLLDVTPQTKTTDFAPAIQTTSGSPTVTLTDPNIANITSFDSVLFNVPVSAGGIILSGLYPVVLNNGTTSYKITATSNAAQTNTLTTNAITAAASATLHFAAVPSWVVAGMLVTDVTTFSVAAIPADSVVVSTTATTIVLSNNVGAPGVGSADSIVITSLPRFTSTSASAVVSVELVAHGRAIGDVVVFPLATTGNGLTISGAYTITAVADANDFSIAGTNQASASGTFDANGGLAEIVYYIALGPPPIGSGFGVGPFGAGGFGTGVTPASQTGTTITATDWTSDNWGEIALACPKNGAVYQYDPTGGFLNASPVSGAPIFNGGIFVSTKQQILVCWGSTVAEPIGIQQDPMLVKWSDTGNFNQFTALTTNQAGSFRIPIGSSIMGGMAVANQNVIWTDIDLWAMNYLGQPFVFAFNKIGSGAGLISSHAAMQLRGSVYWMGLRNFYVFDNGGVKVLPCPVWDFVFQNLSAANVSKVRALPNTPFNEAGWAFPSASSSGECDSYVKFNITEPGGPWDYGTLARSAWIDQTVLGMPIGASPSSIIYQHETGNDADTAPMLSSFTTGYFYIAEGEEFAFVDQIIPDFKWGFFGASQTAQVQLTFNVVNYPGDTPQTFGPYTVSQATQYIGTRFRGRQMSITVASSDSGSFWRLGKVRYRYSAAGRR